MVAEPHFARAAALDELDRVYAKQQARRAVVGATTAAERIAKLRRFREAGSGILLGTDSFWEGVDVPGRALRVLILAKLPFKVPTEPLTAARLERLEARGLNGFAHYLVPNAALKLKQGFGRLIRSRGDVGAGKRRGPPAGLREGFPPSPCKTRPGRENRGPRNT